MQRARQPRFVIAACVLVAIGASSAIAWYGLVDQVPRFSVPLERNGVRTATLAAIAGVGAFVSLGLAAWGRILDARSHAHAVDEASHARTRHAAELKAAEDRLREQLTEERRRSDRLHLTQLFDSAADKLGSADDATRTAGVLILNRLYSDAAALLDFDERAIEQRNSLQVSIIETICGYVRERSVAHCRKWHMDRSLKEEEIDSRYSSPSSVRAAIQVLGRLPEADDPVDYDLTASHLARLDFRGQYAASIDLTNARLRGVNFEDIQSEQTLRLVGATFFDTACFDRATIRGDLNLKGSTFAEALLAEGTVVSRSLWIDGAAIDGDVDLTSMRIEGSIWLQGSTIGGNLKIRHARIGDGADLNGLRITGSFTCEDCKLDRLEMKKTEIGHSVLLRSSEFAGPATLGFSGAAATHTSVLDLNSNWKGRVFGAREVTETWPGPVNIGSATFATSQDDPRRS